MTVQDLIFAPDVKKHKPKHQTTEEHQVWVYT